MDRYVISLDRTPERLAQFSRDNGHLGEFWHFHAIEGAALDRKQLLANGVIAEGISYTDGALGCAFSHIKIWERLQHASGPALICEDDARLGKNFQSASAALLARLPADWDMMYWTWNFNSVLCGGLGDPPLPFVAQFAESEMRRRLPEYLDRADAGLIVRLFNLFGLACYAITPKAAGKLLRYVLPLRPMALYIPGLERVVDNIGLDLMLNGAFRSLQVYAAWPPLALTPNDAASSLTMPPPGATPSAQVSTASFPGGSRPPSPA